MQFNKKLMTQFALIVVAIFAMASGLLVVPVLSPQAAFAEKAVEDEDHAGHDLAENREPGNKHTENMDDLFREKAHNEHGQDHHAEESEDDHSGHNEDVHGHNDGDHEDNGEGHGGYEDGPIRLSATEQQEFDIILARAGADTLEQYVDLPGEIVLNADRVAHVVPRVMGIIRQVNKKQGEQVRKGEVMAVIESRDLADAKAEFLAASERNELANLSYTREERLWKKKITSEQEYLDARQTQVESRIALRSAEQKLHALGFSDDYLASLPALADVTFTRYEIKTPFDGVVIQKHISMGEVLAENAEAFVVADLSTVWVDLQIYQKDLVTIRKGQQVVVQVGHGIPDARGVVDFVGPLLGEETRTALARVVLDNRRGDYRPGMFVTARVAVANTRVNLAVAKSALQNVEGKTVVFVKTAEGFEPQPVEVGRQNTVNVEILAGLKQGDIYVSEGAFTLKAQLSKGAFGDGHNH